MLLLLVTIRFSPFHVTTLLSSTQLLLHYHGSTNCTTPPHHDHDVQRLNHWCYPYVRNWDYFVHIYACPFSYLWIVTSVYTFITFTTLSALENYLCIAVASILKALFDYTVFVQWFLKWHDYKQFNIILIIVGYLFGCLLWFILDVYNLNPLLHLFGYELISSELMAWHTLLNAVIIIWCMIVQKVQKNDIDQDSFAYTLMMV